MIRIHSTTTTMAVASTKAGLPSRGSDAIWRWPVATRTRPLIKHRTSYDLLSCKSNNITNVNHRIYNHYIFIWFPNISHGLATILDQPLAEAESIRLDHQHRPLLREQRTRHVMTRAMQQEHWGSGYLSSGSWVRTAAHAASARCIAWVARLVFVLVLDYSTFVM